MRCRELIVWIGVWTASSAPLHAQCTPGDLGAQLDQLMDDKAIEGTQVSALVANIETGKTVWSRDPDRPLNPASTQKLLTLLAVLDALGPSHKLKTRIEADGKIVDGVLEGDLYIVGAGDPALEFPRWRKLVEDTYIYGIHRITGNIVIDNSLLEPTSIPGWTGGHESVQGALYEAPISALNINYNSLGILISPGANVGDSVNARLEIPTSAATITNQATTTRRGKTQLQIHRQQKGIQTELVLTGTMSSAANTRWMYRSLASPEDYAGVSFREIYMEMGGRLEGELRTGVTPKGTQMVAASLSPNTGYLVSEMVKHSNNQMAEQLAVVAAMSTYGRSNQVAVTRLLTDTLQGHGIDIQGATLLNASGLSRKSRLTARQLVQTTQALYAHPKWSHEAMAAMAIFGRDGTVRNRLKGGPAADSVRAKTGSLQGVSAIAGVAQTQGDQTLAFALLINDLDGTDNPSRVRMGLVDALVKTCPSGTASP